MGTVRHVTARRQARPNTPRRGMLTTSAPESGSAVPAELGSWCPAANGLVPPLGAGNLNQGRGPGGRGAGSRAFRHRANGLMGQPPAQQGSGRGCGSSRVVAPALSDELRACRERPPADPGGPTSSTRDTVSSARRPPRPVAKRARQHAYPLPGIRVGRGAKAPEARGARNPRGAPRREAQLKLPRRQI